MLKITSSSALKAQVKMTKVMKYRHQNSQSIPVSIIGVTLKDMAYVASLDTFT